MNLKNRFRITKVAILNNPLMVLVFLILILLSFTSFFVPDEYLYASLGNSVMHGIRGETSLSSLNTSHTFGFILIIAAIEWMTGISNILILRLLTVVFSLTSIYFLSKVFKLIFKDSGKNKVWLLLLILIPGYFYFSTKLILDIPVLFAFILLIYQLLRRSGCLWYSLTLLLIFLFKEFIVFIALPLVYCVIIFDELFLNGNRVFWLKKIIHVIIKICLVSLPVFIGTIILLFTNFLPYPMILENTFSQIFQGYFYSFVREFVKLKIFFLQNFGLLKPVVETGKAHVVSNDQQVVNLLKGAIPIAPNFFKSNIEAGSGINSGNILWLVYRSNFQEIYINFLILALATFGFFVNIKKFLLRKEEIPFRTSLIFLIILILTILFNLKLSRSCYGFRAVIPAIPAFLFYGVVAINELKKSKKINFFFLFLGLVFIFSFAVSEIYSFNGIYTIYGCLKLSIFILLFLLIMLFLCVPFLKSVTKLKFLTAYALLFFLIHTIPSSLGFVNDYRNKGFNFGLIKSRAVLNDLIRRNKKIYTDLNPVVIDYYGNNYNLNSGGMNPLARPVDKIYQENVFRTKDLSFISEKFNVENDFYLFLVNNGDLLWNDVNNRLKSDKNIVLLKETNNLRTNYPQWKLYFFTKDLSDKKEN